MHRLTRSAHLPPGLHPWVQLGLLLTCGLLVGCSSNDKAGSTASPSTATAPTTTTDPGSRYLDPTDALGEVTVETPPVDGSWTGGPTSIARPVAGTALPRAPDMGTAGLPPPPVRRTPPPPPPPPLR